MKGRIAVYTLVIILLMSTIWMPLSRYFPYSLLFAIAVILLFMVAGFILKREERTYVLGWALIWATLFHLLLMVSVFGALIYLMSQGVTC